MHRKSYFLQAESVSHHLGVPVLSHSSFKPSPRCIRSISDHFSSQDPLIKATDLVVIGDRLLTDVLMANTMGSLSIWTTHVWEKDSVLARAFENKLLEFIDRKDDKKEKAVRWQNVTKSR